MNRSLDFSQSTISGSVNLPLSKSLCNRLLILSAISNNDISIEEVSEANDSKILSQALNTYKSSIDIEDAGTAMRFLTAYFAFSAKDIFLTGSKRMQERPIKILVDALNNLGASISYQRKEGFPPLTIKAKSTPLTNELNINATVSSQYVSALMLIAPKLKNGLTIHLEGNINSRPYLDMTLGLLKLLGCKSTNKDNRIHIPSTKFSPQKVSVEPDWSAASYFYSMFAISGGTELLLKGLSKGSLQGDCIISEWAQTYFGVCTLYTVDGLVLRRIANYKPPKSLSIDFSQQPDLAQTVSVLCACLGIDLQATGLASLKLKETDRIAAIKSELEKFGISVTAVKNTLLISGKMQAFTNPVRINTYKDHRMAMAFAPISFLGPIIIEDAEVVNKSFPTFFSELEGAVSS